MKEYMVKRIKNNKKQVYVYVVNKKNKEKFTLDVQVERNLNMTKRDKKQISRELRYVKKNLNCILEEAILTYQVKKEPIIYIINNNYQHVTLKLTHGEEGDNLPPIKL